MLFNILRTVYVPFVTQYHLKQSHRSVFHSAVQCSGQAREDEKRNRREFMYRMWINLSEHINLFWKRKKNIILVTFREKKKIFKMFLFEKFLIYHADSGLRLMWTLCESKCSLSSMTIQTYPTILPAACLSCATFNHCSDWLRLIHWRESISKIVSIEIILLKI